MRSIINIILFVGLIWFCFYWFTDNNPDRNDPTKIPYIGAWIEKGTEKYAEIQFYLDSGQGNFWDYWKYSDEVRRVTDKFQEIYSSAEGSYQPN